MCLIYVIYIGLNSNLYMYCVLLQYCYYYTFNNFSFVHSHYLKLLNKSVIVLELLKFMSLIYNLLLILHISFYKNFFYKNIYILKWHNWLLVSQMFK